MDSFWSILLWDYVWPGVIILLEILAIILPLLLAVAYLTLAERKVLAAIAALIHGFGGGASYRSEAEKLADETVARYAALGLPAYLAGVYGALSIVSGSDGKPRDVRIDYPRDILRQELDHARQNGTLGF